MATDPDPLVGQVLLGLFRVTEVLGGGATGTVYRGWQMGMERDVAIKVLHQELSGDGDLRLRFFREARAVARLSHPNIVTVYLIDEMAGGQPFLVMEHVRGATLEDLLGDGEVMAPQRSLAIAGQIVSALAEAHAAGVVHRDLKPANILITNRRRVRDFVTVVDFGVAKLTGTEVPMAPGESQLTRQGAVFGTPAYLSPEQARGDAVDARADLYSVGVMLYRMATGRLPFAGEGLAVLLAHVNQPLPPPRQVYPAIDRDLEAVIVQCLDKDPGKRPQSAEALADALDAVEARMARPALAPRVTGAPSGWPAGESSWRLETEMPPARGHRWGWVLALAVVAAAVMVGWRAWPRPHQETSAAMADARPAADAPAVAAADGARRAVIA
ncbi:MAG TPA: serine/threonine-protein kinase, partial [Kofleriaceae bacterium]|nr:serine/threonine-protein kinase [Kofleriaceae bacterium]